MDASLNMIIGVVVLLIIIGVRYGLGIYNAYILRKLYRELRDHQKRTEDKN